MEIAPLFEHQKIGIGLLKKYDKFAILCEMGTGKTRMIIEDFLDKKCNMLIIAPKGAYLNWRLELEKFLPEEIKQSILIAHWISGPKKEDKENIRRIIKPWPNIRRIYLMNVEALSSVKDAITSCELFINSEPCMMVIDESTRIKTHNAQRTKQILKLGEKSQIKRILSGLIAPRSPMDIFSQFGFLDWRILGFRNYYSFRSRYAITKRMVYGGRKIDLIVGYQNVEELQQKIAPFSYRVLKSECLDLPPKIYTERVVELSTEQEKAYKELAKKATTQLGSGEYVTATTAITILQDLHQIICGHVRDDLGNITHLNCSPREQELLDCLEECDGKTIIWCCFRLTLQKLSILIRNNFGEKSLVEFWGDTKDDDREIAKDRFQNDPTCKYFIGNPASGGLSITLTAANQVIYYANDFSLENRLQSEDRAHRAGLKHSVTYIDLIAKGTIDEKILKSLKNKIDVAASITGESAREWIR